MTADEARRRLCVFARKLHNGISRILGLIAGGYAILIWGDRKLGMAIYSLYQGLPWKYDPCDHHFTDISLAYGKRGRFHCKHCGLTINDYVASWQID